MFTKTQEEILKVFVSGINKKFSINQIAAFLKKPYPLMHRSIKSLLEQEFLISDERKLLSLNYQKNFPELAYIEAQRTKERLLKQKNVSLFIEDCLRGIKEDFFVFLIFGSFVEKSGFKDLDVLVIVDKKESLEKTEKIISNIASNFSFKLDLNVITTESAYEMLSKREKLNILNESLNKHLIVFGGENCYRILKNARG
jgi:predicted nucleotidyltransferase